MPHVSSPVRTTDPARPPTIKREHRQRKRAGKLQKFTSAMQAAGAQIAQPPAAQAHHQVLFASFSGQNALP